MVRLYVAPLPWQPFASVALTTIGNVPLWVGVPERTPPVDSERPVGSVDVVENVTAPTVLLAVKVWLKATLTVPVFVDGLLTVMTWQLTVRLYVAPLPAQPLASTACTTIGNVPLCVGVPDRTPPLDSERPVGSVDAVEKVTAPMALLAVKVWLKATFTVPVFVDGLLTVMTWQLIVRV